MSTIMPQAVEQEGDAHWMRQALAAAREAGQRGEVPIGACVLTEDGRDAGASDFQH